MILMKLFSQNPFRTLNDHMEKSMECINKVEQIFEALFKGDRGQVSKLAKEISRLEHECDIIKQEIRGHLSRSVFLPVDRRDILHVLTHMDAIADNAEDVGVLLSLRWMEIPEEIKPDFLELLYASLKVARESSKVINSLGNLFDAGFSGPDAVTVMNLIDNIDKLEHSADKAQDRFGKALFRHEDDMKPAALFMWVKIANKVGDLANSAERMVNNIRTMLASK